MAFYSDADVKLAMASVAPAVESALQKHALDGEKHTAWDHLTNAFQKYPNLTWEVEALAEDVVVHPKNRGGLGTVVANAVQLGFEHVRSGYSYDKACEKLNAFSIPNDPDKKAVIMEFNRTLESEQNLPHAVNPRLQTFGGNNRNVFLRCSRARMQCEPDRDLAPTGVLDPDMLMSGRKGLQTALTKRLKFTVYHHLIDEKWPRIAEIGQAAQQRDG